MLNDLKAQAAYEAEEMERLKAEGREKSATYRQFFGNRLFYKQLLNTYKKYGNGCTVQKRIRLGVDRLRLTI